MTTFTSLQNWYAVQLPDFWAQEVNPDDESSETMTFYHPESQAALRITALEISGKDRENRFFDADIWLRERSRQLNAALS